LNSFITGSHAYGIPAEDSDVDLVVLLSPEDKQLLRDVNGDGPVRFGNLNLILCDRQDQFDCWVKSKADCVLAAAVAGEPLSRSEAVSIHIQNRVNAFGSSKQNS